MQAGWAHEEFETVDLGDERLNKRMVLLAQTLGDKPGASIPRSVRGLGADNGGVPAVGA